jgi:hypothetical protein
MKGPLGARLDRLEAALPDDDRPRRVIRIVASDKEEVEARDLATAEGWDPGGDDICIIRLICSAPTSERTKPPYVQSKSW